MPADEFLENTNQQKTQMTTQNISSFHGDAYVKSGNAHITGNVANLGCKRPGDTYRAAGALAVSGQSVGFSKAWFNDRHPHELRSLGKFRTTRGKIVDGSELTSYTGANLSEGELDVKCFGRTVLRQLWEPEVMNDNGKTPLGRLPRPQALNFDKTRIEERHLARRAAFTKKQILVCWPSGTSPSLKPVAIQTIKMYQNHPDRPIDTTAESLSYDKLYDKEPKSTDSWDSLHDQLLLWRVNNKSFVTEVDEKAQNFEIELMEKTVQSLFGSMKEEVSTQDRREQALTRLQVRLPTVNELSLSKKDSSGENGIYDDNESLAESVCRLLDYIHGPDVFDGSNWPYNDGNETLLEGEWGSLGAVDIATHPRYGTHFTDTLDKAAENLRSVRKGQKPSRRGERRREVKRININARRSRDIVIDLKRLRRQVESSPDEKKSVWNGKWPHAAARNAQRNAAQKLADARLPVII